MTIDTLADLTPLTLILAITLVVVLAIALILWQVLLRKIDKLKLESVSEAALYQQRVGGLELQLSSALTGASSTQAELNKCQIEKQCLLVGEAEALSRLEAASDLKLKLEQDRQSLQTEVMRLRAEDVRQHETIAHLQTAIEEQEKLGQEKLKLLEQTKKQVGLEFKNLANEIFDEKQKTFSQQSQHQLDGLLNPLLVRIKDFEKRVEDSYNQESKERFSLIKEVKNLQELNTRISIDAINLTNALKGENKTQGTWGEVILQRVLEKSGLMKGREYEVQISLNTEAGKRMQPDVIVKLPDGKDLVVDSKVSLVAYERYCSSIDAVETEQALKQHIQSIRQHIRQLGAKNYQDLQGIRTLDFVLLFIPIEAAFSAAVQEDGELFSEAFDKNIVLVAPSTLLATLRTIQNIWRFEYQNQNAQEIADKAGKLYDKFAGFVTDLDQIGVRLDAVQTAYENAQKKLLTGRGNLLGRAEALKLLGIKTNKSLPPGLVEMSEFDKNQSQK